MKEKLKSLGRVLSKGEQKEINGELDGGGCSCNYPGPSTQGTCGVKYNGQIIVYGISQSEASDWANYCAWSCHCSYNWNWCCESC